MGNAAASALSPYLATQSPMTARARASNSASDMPRAAAGPIGLEHDGTLRQERAGADPRRLEAVRLEVGQALDPRALQQVLLPSLLVDEVDEPPRMEDAEVEIARSRASRPHLPRAHELGHEVRVAHARGG